jgi:UDP-2,3-diacylglucosamine hydrolase
MAIFVLSDLHLCAERPEATRAFVRFLSGPARGADGVYLLGDLVEYWIGDDMLDVERPEFVSPLRELSDSGTPVHFMHGNRDFLIGERFARETGCRLLADPTVVDWYGVKTLLMHGDTLCVDDAAYQKFRAQVRDPGWQRDFLRRGYAERAELAKSARAESLRHTRDQPEYIMDVNQAAVESAMRAAGVTRLIHGHTHRPGAHRFVLDGRRVERIVLGDWYTSASALRVDDDGPRAVEFSAAQ